MKCLYHKSDLDGHCAGAIVKIAHPKCEMVGVDYSDSLKDFNIDEGERVIMVDFCFNDFRDMVSLDRRAKLTWIDHHKTSIEKAMDVGFLAGGGQLIEIGRAGCELAWDFFLPGGGMPLAVKLLGRYDVWDHSDPVVLPFQYGMREVEDTHPDNAMWRELFKSLSLLDKIVAKGEIILRYQDKQNAMYAKGMSFEGDFHGFRAIIMNKAYANSKAFDAVYDPDRHDLMILYGHKPGEVKYSLYSDKPEVDVSAIAATHGGGGHAGAAGFYSSHIIDFDHVCVEAGQCTHYGADTCGEGVCDAFVRRP